MMGRLSRETVRRVARRRALTTHAGGESGSTTILCCGLGNMGYEIAGRVKSAGFRTFVHDADADAIERHVREYESETCRAEEDRIDVVLTCLPNSGIVDVAYDSFLHAYVQPGALWIDATSGDPAFSKSFAEKLTDLHAATFLDCAVSGGPAGARAGKLTTMVGGSDVGFERAKPVLDAFASNVVHLGPAGSGHAVKAVNNTLLAAHICAAAEALVALKRFGVTPSRALDAINTSSGRSWVTQQRVPDHVLNRKFDYGFSLENHLKDVRLGVNMMGSDPAPMLRTAETLLSTALEKTDWGPKADHLEVMRLAEKWSEGNVRIADDE